MVPCFPPNRLDGLESFVGGRRRHPDVDDDGIRCRRVDDLEQRRQIPGLADDVDVALRQKARDSLSEKGRVLPDYDAHGIDPLTRVPPAPGRGHGEGAPHRGDAIGQATIAAAIEVRPPRLRHRGLRG